MFESMEYSSSDAADIDEINRMVASFGEEDFEELEQETPWEIFSSQIDNWAEANLRSLDL